MKALLKVVLAAPFADCMLFQTDNVDGATFVEGPHTQRCTNVVTAIDDSGETINDDPVAILTLTVTPPNGAPYQASPHVLVSRLAVPRVGDEIDVSCDPGNPQNT